MKRWRVDAVAATAAGLAVTMIVVYLEIISAQPNDRAAWFLALLGAGALAAGYGAYRGSPRRHTALMIAGVALCGAGLAGLLTIGVPILFAGALALIAAGRSGHARSVTS